MLQVTKRNGNKELVDTDKINLVAERACGLLEDVSASEVVLDAEIQFYDGITTKEIDKSLIYSARAKVEKEPNYNYVAARLLLNTIYKEVFEQSIEEAELDYIYREQFIDSIYNLVEAGICDKRLLTYDLHKLADALVPERDLKFKYFGLQTVYDRYLLTINSRRVETPQAFWMRVAMGVSYNEEIPREDWVIKFYNIYSQFLFVPSTPTLFNSGRVNNQLCSCFTYGTSVLTDQSWEEIQNIQVGDHVLSERGSFEEVKNIRHQRAACAVYELGYGPFSVNVTEDHKLSTIPSEWLTDNKARIWTDLWQEVKDIKVGDYLELIYPKYQEINEDCYSVYYLKDYIDPTERKNKEVREAHLDLMNTDVLEFLGFYYAVGYLRESDTICFPIYEHSDRYTTWLQKTIFDLFKVESKVLGGSTGEVILSVCSGTLVNFFSSTFGLKNKKIPSEFFYLPDEYLKFFLMGIFKSLGRFDGTRGLVINSNSEGVAMDILQLCYRLKLIPFTNKDKRGKYRISLNWLGNEEFLVQTNKLINRLMSNPRSDYNTIWFGDRVFIRLDSKKELKDPSSLLPWVVDLETNGTFCAKLLNAHNCYLSTIDDDTSGIMGAMHQQALLSKYAGGVSLDLTPIRGSNSVQGKMGGKAAGPVPYAKILNDVLLGFDQEGRRRGSGVITMEPWHIDIEDFIQLKRTTGDERRRTHDLNLALWIPDLFYKYYFEDKDWYLFCPSECKELHETYGNEFNKWYESYIKLAEKGKLKNWRKLKAKDLYKNILKIHAETGMLWEGWKDIANLRYANKHKGVIHCSNLCQEIVESNSPSIYNKRGNKIKVGETAVCDLGSPNIKEHLDPNGYINWNLLIDTVCLGIRHLDNVIDVGYYPTEEAENSQLKHRPIGLGRMGWQDYLHARMVPYDSDEAVKLEREVGSFISFHAINASCDLAKERGKYSTYEGSEWDKGKLPIDTYNEVAEYRGYGKYYAMCDDGVWQPIRDKIKKYGMRNSCVLAIAPTATISDIVGCEPCIDPSYALLFTKATLSGDFIIINEYFVKECKKLGIWCIELVNALKQTDGNIKDLKVPERLKRQFKHVFDLDFFKIIDCNAERQKWIDQSISFNIYSNKPSLKYIQDLYLHCWRSMLKTTYYFKTEGASKIDKNTAQTCSINAVRTGELCSVCE